MQHSTSSDEAYDTPDSVAMMSKFLDCITVDFKESGKQEFEDNILEFHQLIQFFKY